MIKDDPELGKPVHQLLPYTAAEIYWICRNEMPEKIEDVLARRTRSLLLNARASAEMAVDVARIMGDVQGRDIAWQEEQVQDYRNLILNYL
jgi:glycerol-3-phosphate dehydrogenase